MVERSTGQRDGPSRALQSTEATSVAASPTNTFTVGIATYRRARYLDDLLSSLSTQSRLPDEVLILEDGDPAPGEAVVRRHTQEFRDAGVSIDYWRADTTGPATARNEIAERASSDVLCFLDDDVRCAEGWLAGIAEGYRNELAPVAVGGPALVVDESLTPRFDLEHASRDVNPISKYGEVGSHAGRWIPPHPVRTDALIGANLSIRTEVFRDIGGFDTVYDHGTGAFEDMDLMARLWRRDSVVLYHPEAFVYHFQPTDGGTRSVSQRTFAYWTARNLIRLRRKNFPDAFYRGLLRYLVYNPYYPPPLAKQLIAGVVKRDSSKLWYGKGFLDGLRAWG